MLGQALIGGSRLASVHLYANFKPRDRGAADRLSKEYDDISEGLQGAGFNHLDRWITEVGFPSQRIIRQKAARNSSEGSQRQRVVEAFYRFAFKDKVRTFLIHKFYDSTEIGGSEANKFGVWRAVPAGQQPQCSDGQDNDGDGLVDMADTNTDPPDCKGTFDTWESSRRPTFSAKAVFCRLGELAALKANPFTFVPSNGDC